MEKEEKVKTAVDLLRIKAQKDLLQEAYEDHNVNPLLHNELNNRDIFRQLAF